jgi:hypothetical protein
MNDFMGMILFTPTDKDDDQQKWAVEKACGKICPHLTRESKTSDTEDQSLTHTPSGPILLYMQYYVFASDWRRLWPHFLIRYASPYFGHIVHEGLNRNFPGRLDGLGD